MEGNMKKFFAQVLVSALVITLVACGGSVTQGNIPSFAVPDENSPARGKTGMEVPYGSTVNWNGFEITAAPDIFDNIDQLIASLDWDEVFGDLMTYKTNKSLNVLYIPSWAGAEYFTNSFAVWKPFLEKYNITLTMQGPTDYTDASQLAVVESALAGGNYDALILYPITPESYAPYMENWWNTYKTPIVTLGFGEETGGGNYFLVTSSQRTKGIQMAQAIFDYCNANAQYFSQYDLIPYAVFQESSAPAVKIWLDILMELLAKDGRFECVATYEVSAEKAAQGIEAIMSTHPEIEFLFTQADDSAVIANNILLNNKKSGMSAMLSIWSQGGTGSAIAAIKQDGFFKGTASSLNGFVGAVWSQLLPIVVGAAQQGILLEEINEIMRGMLAGSLVFTKENVDNWNVVP